MNHRDVEEYGFGTEFESVDGEHRWAQESGAVFDEGPWAML